MRFILYADGCVGVFRAYIYRLSSAARPVMALIFCAHHKDQWQLLFWGNKVFMTPWCIPSVPAPSTPQSINIISCELVQPINKLSYTKKWLHFFPGIKH